MEKNGKTSRCGEGSSDKIYNDKNRSDATGGCKSNPTRSAPRPDMCPAINDSLFYAHFVVKTLTKILVSKETVVLCRWEIETEIYFIKRVDKGQ